jgi:D-3-phosphoglycerate dehydrogenase
MTKPVLLYYDILNYQPQVMDMMRTHFDVLSLPSPAQDEEGLLQRAEVLMAPLGYRVDREKIDSCRCVKVIASSTLSVPHIDVEYARSKGIEVVSLSEEKKFMESITPTAELAWCFIISLTRRIPWAHRSVCDGVWDGRTFGRRTARMLSNMTLGIVGLGRLGSVVASYGAAFGMKVHYYSPSSRDRAYERCPTLLDLAGCCDIVSIHSHLTAETRNMINSEFIHAMKPGSYLINTARGALVDEAALLVALETDHLAGAALDVLADEYEPSFRDNLKDHPLVQYAKANDKLIITPHYAGATVDAWTMTQSRTIELVLELIG